MGAVWMRLRAELRAHWRAWVALALALGIAGGLATAAAAGARRTETAYPRFLEEHRSFHAVTGGLNLDEDQLASTRHALATLPQVEAFSEGQFVSPSFRLPSGREVSFPEALVGGDATGAHLFTINRAKVIEGRMFDSDHPAEAVVDLTAAERFEIRVGDTVEPLLLDFETFEFTVPRPVEVVGIVIAPGQLPAVGSTPPIGVTVSPAFIRANADLIPPNEDGPVVRLRGGVEQLPEYTAAARAIDRRLDFPVILPRHLEGVRKTLRFDVGALWILALLLGLSSLVILGQALARHIQLESGTHDSLRAVGAARAQLVGIDAVRALVIGTAGAAISIVAAAAASPLTPRGLAGIVEPNPGFALDWLAIGIGAAATLACPALVSIVPSVRAARGRAAGVQRPSRLAAALTGAGAGPGAVAGTRLALEPGHGPRSIPVRATIGGIALALAAFAAAGTFTRSLDVLIATPELYGFAWDLFAGSEDGDAQAELLASDPDVEAFTPGGYGNVAIGEKSLLPMLFVPGTIEPIMLEGRVPQADDEIALGASLMRTLGVSIGDTVMVEPEERQVERTRVPFTVVGRPVVPSAFFLEVEPGDASALTLEGMFRLDPQKALDLSEVPYLIKLRPGVDLTRKITELRAALPGLFVGQVRTTGAELSALSRSSGLPVVLTAVLLLMAIGTLVHTLGSSIRKRRHDLAILKTLGFTRRQVRGAIAWQATTLAGFALVLGIPIGGAAGRIAWRWFAGTLGVVPHAVSPVLIAAIVVPLATLALANLIAAVPARAAARTQAAVVLRSE